MCQPWFYRAVNPHLRKADLLRFVCALARHGVSNIGPLFRTAIRHEALLQDRLNLYMYIYMTCCVLRMPYNQY